MNPYFSDMKKRDKANENHKASMRQRIRKNKELYLGQNDNKESYNFPEMTDEEFFEFKRKLKRKRINNTIITVFALLFIFTVSTLIMVYLRR